MNASGVLFEKPVALASFYVYVLIGLFSIAVLIFGILENGIVIYLYVKFNYLRNKTNMLISCLAISDLCMLIFGIPFMVISAFCGGWIFNENFCKFYGFFVSLFGYWSISIICLVAVDRYITIVKFGKGNCICKKATGSTVVVAFALSCIVALFPAFGFGSYELEGIKISCAPHWSSRTPTDVAYIWTKFALYLILPVVIITFVYLRILIKAKRIGSSVRRSPWTRELRVGVIILFTIVVFLLSWTPYSIVSIWRVVDETSTLSPLLETLPALLAKLSCSWNPLIYVCRNKDFRKAFKQAFMRSSQPSVNKAIQATTRYRPTRTVTKMSKSSANNSLYQINRLEALHDEDCHGVPSLVRYTVKCETGLKDADEGEPNGILLLCNDGANDLHGTTVGSCIADNEAIYSARTTEIDLQESLHLDLPSDLDCSQQMELAQISESNFEVGPHVDLTRMSSRDIQGDLQVDLARMPETDLPGYLPLELARMSELDLEASV